MNVSRRNFLKTSSLLASGTAIGLADALDSLLATANASVFENGRFAANGRTLYFPYSNDVVLSGIFGTAYAKSLKRLTEAPIDSVDFILADVDFNQERRFTNYSGDISGRYIEVASLTSRTEKPTPALLPELLDKIVQFQKPDGHFGRDVDWNKTIDIAAANDRSLEMPILWGNGRLMLGLFAAYERFGHKKAFEAAKKLADFYVAVVLKRFCDPNRMAEYRQEAAGYAAAYVTCVFHGIEGLVRAWRLTGDAKYLETAKKMADFHEQFDVLPVGHSHGSISAHEALLMLYEETGDAKYLNRVVSRWNEAVAGGYINPSGGVSEKFEINYPSDEGCSEADWLRLNLMLWRNTGEVRYLDFAERMLFNAYLANQWATGGFGHRRLGVDEKGVFSWQERYAESYWCCSYHGPLGYYEMKEFLAVGAGNGSNKTIYYHFPLDFEVPLAIDGEKWRVRSRSEKPEKNVPMKTTVRFESLDRTDATIDAAIRIPDWATRVLVRAANSNEIVASSDDSSSAGETKNGYLTLNDVASGSEFEISFEARTILEDRRFHRIDVAASNEIPEVVLRYGPDVWVSQTGDGSKIEDLELERTGDSANPIPIPDSLTCVSQMSDAERDGKHSFVFNVRFKNR